MNDLDDQYASFGGMMELIPISIISIDTNTTGVGAVNNDMHITALTPFAEVSFKVYQRGGQYIAASDPSEFVYYGVALVRKDSDGSIDVIASAFSGTGTLDLPTGYTYYRVVGWVAVSQNKGVRVFQPLQKLNAPVAKGISFDATDTVALSGETVQEVLQSTDGYIQSYGAHIDNAYNAHAASAIAYAGGVGLLADNVESAIDELANEKQNITPVLSGIVALQSGIYTPSLVGVTNGTAAAASQSQWLRVNDVVTVSGRFSVDPAAAATATELAISLPVATAFGNSADLGGVAVGSTVAGEWQLYWQIRQTIGPSFNGLHKQTRTTFYISFLLIG